jgi:hypothetical protein
MPLGSIRMRCTEIIRTALQGGFDWNFSFRSEGDNHCFNQHAA